MFDQLTGAERDQFRATMHSAMRKALDEAKQLQCFPSAKEVYGVDSSDYLLLLAEFSALDLDTYPAVAA